MHTLTQQEQAEWLAALQVEEQSQALAAAREQARKAEEVASTQQRMILDQHAKLQLQEEVGGVCGWVICSVMQ
jgi:hypothetical protein